MAFIHFYPLYAFWDLFRVFTDLGTHWSIMVILGYFGAFMKILLKTWRRSRLLKKTSIDGSLSPPINGDPSAKFNNDLWKLRVLPRNSKICTISSWPHVRLFIRVFYVLLRDRLSKIDNFWRQTSLHLEKRA